MGATLSGSWASGRDEEIEETENIKFSEYPFSTGLDGIIEGHTSRNVGEAETTEAG